MDINHKLENMLNNNDGWITLKEVQSKGIDRHEFYAFAEQAGLIRSGRGIYTTADVWPDAMYSIHLRSAQIIFSHESALFLHDLTDREPFRHSVTVKTGYNPHRLKEDGIKVYTIKEELLELGRSQANTPFGHIVPVYDKERTLCDMVRSRNQMDKQILQGAMKAYGRRQDKNLRNLMIYAEALRINTVLTPYLDLLL
jgi:predicted transcriptional regulator of viral defense system